MTRWDFEEERRKAAQDWLLEHQCGGRKIQLRLWLQAFQHAQLDLDVGPGFAPTCSPLPRKARRFKVSSRRVWRRPTSEYCRCTYHGWWGSRKYLSSILRDLPRMLWYDCEAPFFSLADISDENEGAVHSYSGKQVGGFVFGAKLVGYF